MKITIDYLPHADEAIFRVDDSDPLIWAQFHSFLCDYIPSDQVKYSAYSITIPWRWFLAHKADINMFRKAHRKELSISGTVAVQEKSNEANSVSYGNALMRPPRTEEQIKEILRQKGFQRELTPNQLSNLSKISQLPGAATFSVPGAGKTTEALAYFFLNASEADRLLVVAPKNACGAWDEQIDDCMGRGIYQFVRLKGGEGAISKLLADNPRFMIITYDQLPRVTSTIANMLAHSSVFAFLDESHRVKGGSAVKRVDAILNISHFPKQKLLMSGTPMPQGPKDLVSQFQFLYPEKRVDENTVVDLFQPLYVRTTKGQLGIPEIYYTVRYVDMPPLQRELYDSLCSETKRQLASLSDASRHELRQIGKCVMKVMEFTSNPALLASDMAYAYDQRLGKVLLDSDGPKIEYVCRRARELAAEGKKVLIWSCFVKNVEVIALRLKDLGAEYIHGGVDTGDEEDIETREGKIKRFRYDPNCKVLVANPAACSEGISLHMACQYAIYLDRSFNAAHFLQSEDRIHRLGLPEGSTPTVEFVECTDSIDQVVRDRLKMKVDAMATALNDTSLKVDPCEYDYNNDDAGDMDDVSTGLNSEDALAILRYFFGDGK